MALDSHLYYLAGLARSDLMVKKARQINPYLFFAGVAIIIFLMVNMPLFKLLLINKFERLKTSDAVQVTVNLILGSSLLALILLNGYEYLVRENTKNKQELKALSHSIAGNLDSELDSITTQILGFEVADKLMTDKDSLARNTYVFNPDSTEYAMKHYPNINEFLFVDNQGIVNQFISYDFAQSKMDARLYELGYRDYFSVVNDHLGWRYDKKALSNFYLQSIYSWSKGTGEAAISVSADQFPGNEAKTCFSVAAITAPLTSVMNTILPEGFGFAVINKSGSVIFHSDSRKNLMENLIDETDQNKRLMAIIDSQTADFVDIEYNEQSYQAYVTPLQGLPFYLVTFYNKQFSREKNARIINYSFLFLISNLLALALVFTVIWLVKTAMGKYDNDATIIDWLRPIKENRLLYFYLFLLNAAVMLIQFVHFYQARSMGESLKFNILVSVYISLYNYFSLAILNKPARQFKIKPTVLPKVILVAVMFAIALTSFVNGLFFAILIISTVTDILFHYRHRKMKVPVFLPFKKAFSGFYLGFTCCWLMSIGVLTTLISMKVINQDESQLWLRSRQLSVVNQYIDRKQKLMDQLKTHMLPRKKVQYQMDRGVYAGFFEASQFHPQNSPLPHNPLLDNFSEKLYQVARPVFSTYDDRLRSLLSDSSEFKNRIWTRFGNTLTLQVGTRDPQNKNAQYVSLASNLPTYHLPRVFVRGSLNFDALFFWFLILALLTTGTGMIYFVISKVFGITFLNDYKESRVKYDLQYLLHSRRHLFLEGTPNDGHVNMVLHAFEKEYPHSFKTIDFVHPDFTSVVDEVFNNDSMKAVLLKGLEENMGNNSLCSQKLSALEKLLCREGLKIVVCVNLGTEFIYEFYQDLIHENRKNTEQVLQLELMLSRWENLFYNFYHVLFPEELKASGPPIVQEEGYEEEMLRVTDMAIQQSKSHNVELQQQWARHDLANLHHEALWNGLSRSQKIIMLDICQNGLVNTKNNLAIRNLLKKKILIAGEKLALANDGFRNFILNSVKKEEARLLEREFKQRGIWQNYKAVIITVILAIFAFLMFTEQSLVNRLQGILASSAVLIPLLYKVFESLFVNNSKKSQD